MTEHAAQLVETVLPRVPVRQWVLTLPYRLRYRLAWDHGLTRAVLGIYARVLQDFYVRSAHRLGLGRGRTGMLTVVQRFGSGVNLNVHFHTLVLDGVFTERMPGRLQFHAATPPSDEAVAAVLGAIRHRVGRWLARRGLAPGAEPEAPDGLAEISPVLAEIMSASVQGRVALGRQAGARVERLGGEPPERGACGHGPRQAHLDGFDLHADVRVPPNDRARLEHRCRYLLRPVRQGRVSASRPGEPRPHSSGLSEQIGQGAVPGDGACGDRRDATPAGRLDQGAADSLTYRSERNTFIEAVGLGSTVQFATKCAMVTCWFGRPGGAAWGTP